MRALVKRYKASGHEEVNVVINFEGLPLEDVRLLAEFYVQHRVECELKGYESKLPDSIVVFAADYIHQEVFVAKPINLPPKIKGEKKSKEREQFEAATKGLTKAELAELFGDSFTL